ncbi:anoctamin-4-like isoform X2 [Choristoneura fumiferana]|uniref:anoctamin-4-like isoform X2 n=1 Tax=Choristoneura fumiferana TaxID=7141 RepID=UPI003D156AEF
MPEEETKTTAAAAEPEPEVQAKVQRGLTGFFRDGIRRIDLVLVMEDDGILQLEALKVDFLVNVLKFGLQLELEPGVMVYHKNLVFIKVHAPESIIEEYGRKFEVIRNFEQAHTEFVNPKGFIRRLLGYLPIPIDYTGLYEKEWIKLVRRKYPHPKRISTLERSIIVHKLLHNLPFGDHENYVGLHTMLEQRLVLDAFPLHDGPYFAVPGQYPTEYNARQILNYNWAGLGNLLKFQPLSLINEYFGDRMAFLFAFYGFYTFSLIFPAIISTKALIPEIYNKTDYNLSEDGKMFYDSFKSFRVCARCRHIEACPYLPYAFSETSVMYNNMIDRENIDAIVVYIVIWATLFVLFWRRKEYYWMWMWECKPEILAHTVRPEYVPDKKELQGKKKGQLSAISKSINTLIRGLLVIGCFLLAWCGFAVSIMLLQELIFIIFLPKFHYGLHYGRYKVLTILYVLYVLILLIVERVLSFVSYTLTNSENHRTESDYEKSLVLKLFAFTFSFTCTLFLYIAFFKNQFYNHPSNPTRYKYWGILMAQCTIFGCSDELALSIFVTIITKDCVFKVISLLYGLLFMRTDYNQGRSANITVPCWEREYRLTPVKKDFVDDKLKSLAIQFGVSVGFICGCPLTLFFIICGNVLDIRITARRLLKGCRRPLVQNNLGFGSWKKVFILLIFATLIINNLPLEIRQELDIAQKKCMKAGNYAETPYEWPYNHVCDDFLAGHGCTFQGPDFGTFSRQGGADNYVADPNSNKRNYRAIWYRRQLAAHYLLVQVSLTVLAIVVLFHIIPARQNDIEQTVVIQKAIIEMK